MTLAAYKGHYDVVHYLLEKGANKYKEELHTALMEASMDGHYEVAKLLLDNGAPVNLASDSFESPLTLAACGGHPDLVINFIINWSRHFFFFMMETLNKDGLYVVYLCNQFLMALEIES